VKTPGLGKTSLTFSMWRILMKRANGLDGRKMSWAGVWIHFAGFFIQSQIIPPRPAEILRPLFQKGERVKEQKLKPPHTTKPNDDVGVGRVDGAVRVAVVAIGAPREGGGVGGEVATAAAQHTEARSWPRSGWISCGGLAIWRPIPVPTPLKHIPRHVV
jgi:hypothetical protein